MKGSYIQSKLLSTIKECKEGMGMKWESPSYVGLPDILYLYKGRALVLEVKGDGDRLRPHQLAMHERLKGHLIPTYTITSWQEGMNYVTGFVGGVSREIALAKVAKERHPPSMFLEEDGK